MHVAQLNFLPAPPGLDLEALLARWPSLVDIAEVVASAGIEVSVLQAARQSGQFTRNGVGYRFVDVGGARSPCTRGQRFAAELDGRAVDLLHAHGLAFVEDAAAVAACVRSGVPLILQDHADRPPRWWRRSRHRRGFAVASGVAFTAPEQARPFLAAGLFGAALRQFAIPESSSRFTPADQARARATTGLRGDPCVLWLGRLTHGKDPLTVLDGIAMAAGRLPDLQLWCAYGAAPLLAAVRARIAADTRLTGRVHLLGRVPHVQVEALLRAADLFVSGSHAEGSGYAAIEALACGTTPVLSDIPAFRALTADGRVGQLWKCGVAAQLAEALIVAANRPPSRERVRAHFDAQLSFEAVGRRWADAYAQVLDTATRRAA